MTTKSKTEQRKKLKRYDIPGHAHELTFSCSHVEHGLKARATQKGFVF